MSTLPSKTRLERSDEYLGNDRDQLREIIIDRDIEIERLTGERAIVAAAMMARIPDAPPVVEALQQFVRQWNACGPNSDFGRYFQKIRDGAVDALAKYQLSGKDSGSHETPAVAPFPYPTDRDGWICSVCHGWNGPKTRVCLHSHLPLKPTSSKAAEPSSICGAIVEGKFCEQPPDHDGECGSANGPEVQK